jgi:hypothetical protein
VFRNRNRKGEEVQGEGKNGATVSHLATVSSTKSPI